MPSSSDLRGSSLSVITTPAAFPASSQWATRRQRREPRMAAADQTQGWASALAPNSVPKGAWWRPLTSPQSWERSWPWEPAPDCSRPRSPLPGGLSGFLAPACLGGPSTELLYSQGAPPCLPLFSPHPFPSSPHPPSASALSGRCGVSFQGRGALKAPTRDAPTPCQ